MCVCLYFAIEIFRNIILVLKKVIVNHEFSLLYLTFALTDGLLGNWVTDVSGLKNFLKMQ